MAADPAGGPTPERIDGPTPDGGDYSIAYFRDAEGNPCPRAEAAEVEVVEFSADGEQINRTYLTGGADA